MFPAWMLLWILFALLQQRLARKESMGTALVRGVAAAIVSGAAFYAISGIWINDSHTNPNLLRHFGAWTVAFLPGFVALFLRRYRRLPSLLDHLAVERRDVVRLARRDQPVVGHAFLIDPVRAGVLQVRAQ